MKKVIFFLMIAGTMLYAGPTLTPEVKALLSNAKANVSGITANHAKKLIDENSAVFIDVRDPDEWEKGVINTGNLVKVSRGFLEVKYPKVILKKYNKNDTFIVYCALEPRSVFAASRLKELGFTNVKYLQKGFKNWTKQGLPTKK